MSQVTEDQRRSLRKTRGFAPFLPAGSLVGGFGAEGQGPKHVMRKKTTQTKSPGFCVVSHPETPADPLLWVRVNPLTASPHLTWSHPQPGQKHQEQEPGFPHLPLGPGQEGPSEGKRSRSRDRQPNQRGVLQGARWRKGSSRKRDRDRDLEGEGRDQ